MTTKITSLEGLTRYDYVPGEAGRMIIGQEDEGSYVLFTDVRALLASQAEPAEVQKLQLRVSELEAARIAYANEFPPTADGDPDVGNIHANIRALKAVTPLSQPHQAVVAAGIPSGLIMQVKHAMTRAFDLGQKYWQQADSDYVSQHKKSEATAQTFRDLNESICAMLEAAPLPSAPAPVERAEPAGWLDPRSGSFYPSRKSVEKYAPFPDKVKPMYFDIATPSAPVGQALDLAARDVLAERRRQVDQEGWSSERDDGYTDFSLARAAAAYAMAASADRADRAVMDDFGPAGLTGELKRLWPQSWSVGWFKPKSRRADLVKSGALILAEIERIDRAALLSAPVNPAATDQVHLPGWERGIATVTINGHQLREALEFINPGGDDEPDELDNDLTFGIVKHADEHGEATTGLCCWSDDSDGVLPLNGGDDQKFDRNAERITRDMGLGGGTINPNATSIDDLFLDEGAPVNPVSENGGVE